MELKQNICVYIEIVGFAQQFGALSPLSIELLGKARQLADAKGKQVVAFVAGADTAKASQEAISYGADAVVAVEDSVLAAYDSVLYTKAIAALAEKYEPSVILIGGSPDGRDLGGRLSAQLGVGLVADCTDVRFEGDDDTLTWIRPAYTGKLFVKIQTTTRPQLATISDKIFHGTPADPARKGEIIKESVDFAGAAPSVKVTNFEPVEKEPALLYYFSSQRSGRTDHHDGRYRRRCRPRRPDRRRHESRSGLCPAHRRSLRRIQAPRRQRMGSL